MMMTSTTVNPLAPEEVGNDVAFEQKQQQQLLLNNNVNNDVSSPPSANVVGVVGSANQHGGGGSNDNNNNNMNNNNMNGSVMVGAVPAATTLSSSSSPSRPLPPSSSSGVSDGGGLSVAGLGQTRSVATMSSPWQFDDLQLTCTSCNTRFNTIQRKHHCRLCGKIFCNSCSKQKALIPPSSIVLVPTGGKKVKPRSALQDAMSFTQDDDPDRMLTYLSGGPAGNGELLYGKGLEHRFQLAREPLRVCKACYQRLQPMQEELCKSNSNSVRFNHVDPTDVRRMFNSPLAFTLGHEIRKAAYTLNNLLPLPKRMGATILPGANTESFHNHLTRAQNELQQCKKECIAVSPSLANLDGIRIPARLLEEAKGVAVLTVCKGGFGVAGVEFGTGLAVARLDNNNASTTGFNDGSGAGAGGDGPVRWSAPCAIGAAGVSWGALIGAQVSDHVFLLMTSAAVDMLFSNKGSIQLGADIGVAVGPVGRALEADVGAATQGKVAPIYTYSLSKGFYAGISLDGKVIVTRNNVNEKFYGRSVTGQEILRGNIPTPPAAQPLYEALTRCRYYAATQASGSADSASKSLAARRAMVAATLMQQTQQQQQQQFSTPQPPPQHLFPPAPQLRYEPQEQSQQQPQMFAATAVVATTTANIPAPTNMRDYNGGGYPQLRNPINNNVISSGDVVGGGGIDVDPLFPYHGPQTLMPPADNDQHSYAGAMSDITSDPGY